MAVRSEPQAARPQAAVDGVFPDFGGDLECMPAVGMVVLAASAVAQPHPGGLQLGAVGVACPNAERAALRVQSKLQMKIFKKDGQSEPRFGMKKVKFSGLPRQEIVSNQSDL